MIYLSKGILLMALVSPVGAANTLLDDLSKCAKNDDSLKRLECYDHLAQKTSKVAHENVQLQSTILESNPEQQATVAHPLPATPAKSLPMPPSQPTAVVLANTDNQQYTYFGLENKRHADEVEQITASITKITKNPRGEKILTLDNGQVWRQIDSTSLRLRENQTITIKRGALGSFFIGKETVNKRMRAKRVK